MLLWQTSLGGTVRQCSCPCQGKQYPLSPPPLPIFNRWQLSRAGFQGCCKANSGRAALPHPPSHCSTLWNSAWCSEELNLVLCKDSTKWVVGFFLEYCSVFANPQIQNSCATSMTLVPPVAFTVREVCVLTIPKCRGATHASCFTEMLPTLSYLHSKV